jgi:hypothetical protein
MRLLFSAKVGTVKEFLQADDLAAFARGFLDQLEMLFDHRLLDSVQGRSAFVGDGGLD